MSTVKKSFIKPNMFQMKSVTATHLQTIYWTQIAEVSQYVLTRLGFVLKFIKNLKRRPRKQSSDDQYKSEIKNVLLMDEEIKALQPYFLKRQPLKSKGLSKDPSISRYL